MTIIVTCSTCGARIKAPGRLAGKTAKCPKCHGAMQVPDESAALIRGKTDGIPLMPIDSSIPPPSSIAIFDADEVDACDHHEEDRNDDHGNRQNRRATRQARRAVSVGGVETRGKTDAFGIISLIFGFASLLLLFMVRLSFGFSSFISALLAIIGVLLGVFARGNLRVASITLNALVFLPAATLACLLAVGLALGKFGPSVGDPRGTSLPSSPAKSPPDDANRWPVAEINAPDLLNAYRTALAADRLYGGKAILLSGISRSSERTSRGAKVCVGDFDGNEIDCYFRSEDEAASVKLNHSIVVLGLCKGVNAHRTVDLVDCELVPDIVKYRVVSTELVQRFDGLMPAKAFGGSRPDSFSGQVQRRKQMSAYEGSIIEVSGLLYYAPTIEDANPKFAVDEAICHFDPRFASTLKGLRKSWWIRVRGKVRTRKDGGIELLDCGLRLTN